MTRTITFLFFLSFSIPSMSLDLAGYKHLKETFKSDNQMMSVTAKTTIQGYFQGLADMMTISQRGRKISLAYQEETFHICLPNTVEITANLLETITDAEITAHSEHYKFRNANWENLSLPTFTFVGLGRNYFCES